jgi:hypothetical protein
MRVWRWLHRQLGSSLPSSLGVEYRNPTDRIWPKNEVTVSGIRCIINGSSGPEDGHSLHDRVVVGGNAKVRPTMERTRLDGPTI